MKSCMRLLGFILSTSIVLALFAVTYESEYWSLWGVLRKSSPSVTNIAEAAPIPGDAVDESSGLASEDVSTDVVRDAEVEQGSAEDEQEQQEPPTEEVQKDNYSPEIASTETTREEQKEEPQEEREEEPQQEPKGELKTEVEEKLLENESKDLPTESKSSNQSPEEKQNTHMFDPEDKPEYHTKNERRSRAKSFLVVFMGHSGSTAFITELRTHSEFLVEKLEPVDHHEYHRDTDLAYEYAKELMDRGIAQGKIPGFKIRPYHILNKPELWKKFVKDYDCRVIWQYRENIMKQAIGEYRNRYLNDTSVVEGLSTNEKLCAPGSDQKCTFHIEDMKFLHNLMNAMSGSDELLASAVRTLERHEDMSIVKGGLAGNGGSETEG
ncbi:hypothetical protein FGB62_112g03 [Gracilaria domingensis]|nr:hypothetical protein FGB62_112g03 [Gracilaria domingensis]